MNSVCPKKDEACPKKDKKGTKKGQYRARNNTKPLKEDSCFSIKS